MDHTNLENENDVQLHASHCRNTLNDDDVESSNFIRMDMLVALAR